ncbi:MAG: photosystem reaction center subunit [Friedmanniella sp.]|nr:photosystem reaction center subunit [Friedmanniella sp.]
MNSTSQPAAGTEGVAAVVQRSEERLAVGRTVRAATRVRVSKRVVTEQVTFTVPVRREELVVEYEPLEPGSIPDLPQLPEPGAGFTIVLHEERVTVGTETVAVERVHVAVTRRQGHAVLREDLLREHVQLDDPATS